MLWWRLNRVVNSKYQNRWKYETTKQNEWRGGGREGCTSLCQGNKAAILPQSSFLYHWCLPPPTPPSRITCLPTGVSHTTRCTRGYTSCWPPGGVLREDLPGDGDINDDGSDRRARGGKGATASRRRRAGRYHRPFGDRRRRLPLDDNSTRVPPFPAFTLPSRRRHRLPQQQLLLLQRRRRTTVRITTTTPTATTMTTRRFGCGSTTTSKRIRRRA